MGGAKQEEIEIFEVKILNILTAKSLCKYYFIFGTSIKLITGHYYKAVIVLITDVGIPE